MDSQSEERFDRYHSKWLHTPRNMDHWRYRTYHRNGGNFLDKTPDGKQSILFKTLIDHFGGDINKAIVAKSNVYSDAFAQWFGDWTAEDKNDVSKVVDENGEPLIVWHGNRTDNKIRQFDKSKIGSEHKEIVHGFWFID